MYPLLPYKKPPMGTPIDPKHPLSKGLVGAWLMNEARGGKIYDKSGNSNTGTLVGDTHFVPGKFGPALSFDGTGDYVDAGEGDGITGNQSALTISTWLKRDTVVDQRRYAVRQTSVLLLGIEANTRVKFLLYGTAYAFSNSGIDTNWHHVVGVYNGSKIFLYLDGVLQSTVSDSPDFTGNTVSSDYNLLISNDWNGQINNVQIYNRALSASEVKELYINPFAMMLEDTIVPFVGGGTEYTASFTPVPLSLTIPAVTASFVAPVVAGITALSLLLTPAVVTASYQSEQTASFTPVSVVLTVPATTATYEAELSASFTALSLVATIPATTPNYQAELTSAFTPLSLIATIPATTPTYLAPVTPAFTPLSLVLTIPLTTASSSTGAIASYTPLSLVLTIPANTPTYQSELTTSFTPLSLIITNPSTTASYTYALSSSFTPLSLIMNVPAMTASSSTGVGGGTLKVWTGTQWLAIA